jgi:hypothetical protein
MTTETKFRGGLTMALMGLIIMTFFYFQQQDELRKCKEGNVFLQGGDIEKSQLTNRVDSLMGELEAQKLITDYTDRLWIKLSELHPKDAEKVKHETE